MAASSSSSPFFGIGGDEDLRNQIKQQHRQQLSATPTSLTAARPPPPLVPQPKKKRNQPGTPYPDAEVIALSPKTLMATNRFICEVCNKGFQREQNLQLHRRGHNLPWKLKQKSTKEVRRRVYLCPEPTCVHHDPSRALGDLTGIKKHFCRKHGEKKWKCDKCSKRYAVQSDWKAHSKTCGTREYRCDCGTLFSRRDSFITHRAFCDALAQESARIPTGLSTIGGHHLYGSNVHNMGLGLSTQMNSQMPSYLHDPNHPPADLLRLGGGGGGGGGTQFDHIMGASSNHPSFRLSASTQAGSPSPFFFGSGGGNQDFNDDHNNKGFHHGLMQLPDLQASNDNHVNTPSPAAAAAAATFFNLSFFSNTNTAATTTMNNGRSSNNNSSSSNSNNQQKSNLLISSEQLNNRGGSTTEQANLFSGNLIGENLQGSSSTGVSSLYNNSCLANESSILPQMSATALLQKAAQMGATTTSCNINNGAGGGAPFMIRSFGSSSSSSNAKPTNLRSTFGGENMRPSHVDPNEAQIQALMNSLANGNSSIFGSNINNSAFGGGGEQDERNEQQQHQHHETCKDEGTYGGFNTNLSIMDDSKLHQKLSMGSMGGSDRLTRDFLGVGGMVRNPLVGIGRAQREHDQHGLEIDDCLDPEMK